MKLLLKRAVLLLVNRRWWTADWRLRAIPGGVVGIQSRLLKLVGRAEAWFEQIDGQRSAAGGGRRQTRRRRLAIEAVVEASWTGTWSLLPARRKTMHKRRVLFKRFRTFAQKRQRTPDTTSQFAVFNHTIAYNRHVATLGQGGGGSCSPRWMFWPPPFNVPLAIFSTHYLITTMLVYSVTETVDIVDWL